MYNQYSIPTYFSCVGSLTINTPAMYINYCFFDKCAEWKLDGYYEWHSAIQGEQKRANVTPTRACPSQTYKNPWIAYSLMLLHFHNKVVQSVELENDMETIDLSIQDAWDDLNFADHKVRD